MPKNNIDYSNTIIYKIYCKDKLITDIYVGHTTNFVIRKYQHKVSCRKSEVKIYKTIRNNGGWENWNMVEIAKYNCKDSIEARIMEQKHYEELNATLNSCPPYIDTAKYFCSICNKQCNGQLTYETHINCILHNKKTQAETKSCEKVAYKFSCEYCDYSNNKKSSYDKHLTTAKHLKLTNVNKKGEISCINKQFICEFCDKTFMSRVGLWKHKKKCTEENIKNELTNSNDKLVSLLVKENAEFKNIIIKLLEKVSSTNITNNNTNSHNTTNNDNKTFNLNFFLNETCKDAMNINDFVSSIKVSLSDLENTGRQGYIEGITNIVLKNLNNVEHNLRPLHCSDIKREVFYIKDNNEWKKENEEKPILTKTIKVIANENIKQIKHWRDKYPDCTDSDSKKNNLYLKIVSNSMNGSTAEESIKNIDKIISNVAKEVIIDKTNL